MDVFISYSRKDYVDENNVVIPNNPISAIKDLLKKNNITYWFDEEGIYHGDNFAEKIASNIEDSQIVLFFSSENSNRSIWTSKEIAAATEWKKKIIPIRLDKTPYNRTIMLYVANLDFVEFYADTEAAQRTILESIQKAKEEIEKKRLFDEEQKQKKQKEQEERERAEKRKLEQEELSKEIATSIQIMRLSEEALEKQRPDIVKQINSLDSQKERKKFLLLLEQSNQTAFEERAKSRLLLDTIDKLNKEMNQRVEEELANGGYISKKQAEEERQHAIKRCQEENQKEQEIIKSEIEKLTQKCQTYESDFEHGETHQRQQNEINNLLKELSNEKRKNTSLEKEKADNCTRLSSFKTIKRRLHIIYTVLLLCIVSILSYYVYSSSESRIYKDIEIEKKNREITALTGNINALVNTLNKIKGKTPLFIEKISIKNGEEEYDEPIYSKNTTYLYPRIKLLSLIEGDITIYCKLYAPYGLTTGKTSPKGYSWSNEIKIPTKNQTYEYELQGWGKDEKGYWSAGTYRYEFYYNGVCIGTKTFKIL